MGTVHTCVSLPLLHGGTLPAASHIHVHPTPANGLHIYRIATCISPHLFGECLVPTLLSLGAGRGIVFNEEETAH